MENNAAYKVRHENRYYRVSIITLGTSERGFEEK